MVTLKTANPQAGDFTFPMEFSLADNAWQLTRRTADVLLQLGRGATRHRAPPTPTPTR